MFDCYGNGALQLVNFPGISADHFRMSFTRNRPKLLLTVIPVSLLALAASLTVNERLEAASLAPSPPGQVEAAEGAPPAETNVVVVTTVAAAKAAVNPSVPKSRRSKPVAANAVERVSSVVGIDWRSVESRIKRVLMTQRRTRIGLVVKDLRGEYQMAYNADARFASASLVKIPVAVGLFHDIEAGKIDRRVPPVFEEKHRIGGSGVLRRHPSGGRYELDELLYLMLAKSDNTATNILSDLVGMDRVTEVCRAQGWKGTNMVRDVMALDLRRHGVENWTTPRDMAAIFEGLYRGSVVSPGASAEILRYMLNPPIADRLPRKIPRSVNVVHKTGLIYDNAHDVGILYLPGGNVVLVSALVDHIGSDYRRAKSVISEIAKIVYEEALEAEQRRKARSEA